MRAAKTLISVGQTLLDLLNATPPTPCAAWSTIAPSYKRFVSWSVRRKIVSRRSFIFSGSVFLRELINVGGSHQLERDFGETRHFLALGERDRGLQAADALTGRVLEHRDVEVARLHCHQRILAGVDSADDDIVHADAGRLHRL